MVPPEEITGGGSSHDGRLSMPGRIRVSRACCLLYMVIHGYRRVRRRYLPALVGAPASPGCIGLSTGTE